MDTCLVYVLVLPIRPVRAWPGGSLSFSRHHVNLLWPTCQGSANSARAPFTPWHQMSFAPWWTSASAILELLAAISCVSLKEDCLMCRVLEDPDAFITPSSITAWRVWRYTASLPLMGTSLRWDLHHHQGFCDWVRIAPEGICLMLHNRLGCLSCWSCSPSPLPTDSSWGCVLINHFYMNQNLRFWFWGTNLLQTVVCIFPYNQICHIDSGEITWFLHVPKCHL